MRPAKHEVEIDTVRVTDKGYVRWSRSAEQFGDTRPSTSQPRGEDFDAPWIVIARAGGPYAESEYIEARLHQCPGEPDADTITKVRETIIDAYRKGFEGEPTRVGVVTLPSFQNADGSAEDD